MKLNIWEFLHKLITPIFTTPPSGRSTGEIWYESTANKFRWQKSSWAVDLEWAGVSNITKYFITSTVVVNTTATSVVSEWTFPVISWKKYKIDFFWSFNTAYSTTWWRFGVSLSSGSGTLHWYIEIDTTNSASAASLRRSFYWITTWIYSFCEIVWTACVWNQTFSWTLIFECTWSWDFQPRWGSDSASSNANLLAWSLMIVEEL